MKKLAVFCGSAMGQRAIYQEHAKAIGTIIAKEKIGLVYGGGAVGLMGVLADAVMENGGKVWGVIPESLQAREVGHNSLTELHVVKGMHERKKLMYDLADAFLILPGGIGTLDEFFEVFTWSQLGIHQKEIYILNTEGIYAHLIDHLKLITAEGFISKNDLDSVVAVKTPEEFKSIVLPKFLRS